MNPWKIIGWIVLGFILLMLYACIRAASNYSDQQASPGAPSPAQPSYAVQVVSVECVARGRDRADITVRNTGSTPIPFAKAFAQFTDSAGNVVSAGDSYFSPHDIPAGATASADVYSNGSGAAKCAITGIQDRDGNQVTLQ